MDVDPPDADLADMLVLLRQGCAEVSRHDVGPLEPGVPLEALGIDSVQLLELVAWTEAQLGVRVSDDELAMVRSVGDLAAMLLGRFTRIVR